MKNAFSVHYVPEGIVLPSTAYANYIQKKHFHYNIESTVKIYVW